MKNLKQKLAECAEAGRAVLATNFYNFETLRGVIQAAGELNQPLILQLTRSSIEYIGLKTAVALARQELEAFNVEGWIHLDHGDTVELVQKCLDSGFDSVMIDGSELPIVENIKITREVVKLAEKFNAHVEAELGFVAKLGQQGQGQGFTKPEDARMFCDQTGVDSLAVAIGSAHGFYTKAPELQLERLAEIHQSIPNPLVLHGSSGIPDDMLQLAINRGICKVNLATEIKNTFMVNLQTLMKNTTEIDLRKVFPLATASVTKLVKQKLAVVANRR